MMSSRRSCETCRARKVRCSGKQGSELRCATCIIRKEECRWSPRKQRARRARSSPSGSQTGREATERVVRTPTPESTSSARQPAAPPTRRRHDDRPAIDIADEPQFEYLFEGSESFVSSSNIAFFSPKALRLLSARLGHNRVEQLFEGLKKTIYDRLGDIGPIEFPRSPGTVYNVHADLAKKYVKGYFDFVHPLYPFLDQAAFETKLSDPDVTEGLENNIAWSALYHAVLAIGCQWTEQCVYDINKCPSWEIFSTCLVLLPRILVAKLSLLQIQAVTAMAIFCLNTNGMPIQDLLVGEATRLALEARLHQWSSKSNNGNAAKLFWVIYVMDRMVRFLDGKSSLIHDSDISTPNVRVLADFRRGQAFTYFLSLSKLYTQAYERLFCVRARSLSASDQYAAITEILDSLEDWADRLPSQIQPRKITSDLSVSCPIWVPVTIHMFYYNLRIVLYRLALQLAKQPDQRLEQHRIDMWQCSRDILDYTRLLDLKPCTPLWTIGIIPLAALFILFDAAVFNPKHPETRTNLIFLDIAAGYFSRLEYASGGYFRSSFLGEFAAMAKSFIRAHEQSKQPGSKTPIQPEKTSRPEDSSRDNFGSTLGQEDVGQPTTLPAPEFDGALMAGAGYTVENDPWLLDASLAGLDVMNLFGMEMPNLSDDWSPVENRPDS